MPRFNQALAVFPEMPAAPQRPSRPTVPGRSFFTIGEMVREFGVTHRTLRFYEQKGLLVPYKRHTTRLYSQAHRAKLGTILRGKELGFNLREIKAMLATGEPTGEQPDLVLSQDKVAGKLCHLEAQRIGLEKALVGLRGMHGAANGNAVVSADPALVAVADWRSAHAAHLELLGRARRKWPDDLARAERVAHRGAWTGRTQALERLYRTVPETLAGLAAYARAFEAEELDGIEGTAGRGLRALLDGIARLAREDRPLP